MAADKRAFVWGEGGGCIRKKERERKILESVLLRQLLLLNTG